MFAYKNTITNIFKFNTIILWRNIKYKTYVRHDNQKRNGGTKKEKHACLCMYLSLLLIAVIK